MDIFHPLSLRIPVIGLDICGPVIRAVQLSAPKHGKREILAIGESELSPAAAADPFANAGEMVKSVRKVLEKPLFGNFRGNLAVSSLPEHRCFSRVIHVQKGMKDKEIDQAVPFEAESYIPVALDQMRLDWQKIPGTDERTALLLAAAPVELVEKAESLISDAGLMPANLEVESMSVARGTVGENSEADILIADIGTSRTDLIILEQGSVQFASSIPVAEGMFVETFAKAVAISKVEAAKVVRQVGVENTEKYPNQRQILNPVLSMLAAEIQNIISFHDQHSSRRFSKLVLVGRGASLPHLDTALQTTLSDKLPVEIGTPWQTANVSNIPIGFSGASAVRFTAAIGLSIKSINDL